MKLPKMMIFLVLTLNQNQIRSTRDIPEKTKLKKESAKSVAENAEGKEKEGMLSTSIKKQLMRKGKISAINMATKSKSVPDPARCVAMGRFPIFMARSQRPFALVEASQSVPSKNAKLQIHLFGVKCFLVLVYLIRLAFRSLTPRPYSIKDGYFDNFLDKGRVKKKMIFITL